MKAHACALGALVALGAGACGGDVEVQATPHTSASTAVDEGTFPAALAAALCERAAECCVVAGFAGRTATCEVDRRADYERNAAHARSLGAAFDETRAAACLAAVRTPAPSCPSLKDGSSEPLHCLDVYRGTKPPGSACDANWGECASTGEGHGHCDTISTAAGVTRTCLQHGLSDTTCGVSDELLLECRSGSYCDAGVCRRRQTLGEACSRANGDFCAVGLLCGDDGRCAPPPKKPGEVCTQAWECEGPDCTEGRCRLQGPFAKQGLCATQ